MIHTEFRTMANYIYSIFTRILRNSEDVHKLLVISLKYWIHDKPTFKNFDRLGFPWPDSDFHGIVLEYYLDPDEQLRLMKSKIKIMKTGDIFKRELISNGHLDSKNDIMWSLYDMSKYQLYSVKVSHDEFEFSDIHKGIQKMISEDLHKIIYKHLDLMSNKKDEQLSRSQNCTSFRIQNFD